LIADKAKIPQLPLQYHKQNHANSIAASFFEIMFNIYSHNYKILNRFDLIIAIFLYEWLC
ncbi:hypothetical protein, partial [Proteus hauseri]|uniref:hypothetical protein n=1 Tax=Proteus hauseri TaxID=183417 RepID=UPI001960D1F3